MNAWWEYMSKYDDFCVQQGNMNLCGRNSILDLGLDYQHIQRCVNQTFDTSDPTNCKVNKRLDEEESVMLKDGVSFYPSVSINGFTYRVINKLPSAYLNLNREIWYLQWVYLKQFVRHLTRCLTFVNNTLESQQQTHQIISLF